MITKKDTVLVTGCGGMLGEAVYAEFKDICKLRATDIDLNAPWLSYLDVRDTKAVTAYLRRVRPNYILHLAALTDMEYCERHADNAYQTNSIGVENLASYARKHKIPFLYISTAGVFDGEKDRYRENDQPNPLSVYGRSKFIGEAVARATPGSVVIRAGWMMGGGPKKDKKFINKIIKQIRAGKTTLQVVDDKLGTPCYTYDLARSMHYLLDHKKSGIFHGACNGSGSRYDVAKELVKQLGLAKKITVKKIGSSALRATYFAPRPRSETLVNINLKKLNPKLTRDWKVCLSEYVGKFSWLSR
ncbi:SDR family oxidoreductase [Patescibacteria group bacterium]|nr:SDR family oxidoreductase [Patescibacteria group bacterium]